MGTSVKAWPAEEGGTEGAWEKGACQRGCRAMRHLPFEPSHSLRGQEAALEARALAGSLAVHPFIHNFLRLLFWVPGLRKALEIQKKDPASQKLRTLYPREPGIQHGPAVPDAHSLKGRGSF